MLMIVGRTRLDTTAQRFVETVAKYVLMTVGIVAVLRQLRINTGSVLASLSVLGLTIGFAAQNTLSNVISDISYSGTDRL
ncbi:MAG: small conductance mechanosensitive channel [Bradymonadia bacterium]|jgi:small conductance mechanosensitive channel